MDIFASNKLDIPIWNITSKVKNRFQMKNLYSQ